jgi:hypothetical protein
LRNQLAARIMGDMTDLRLQPGRSTEVVGAHRGTTIMRLVSVGLRDAGPLDRFIASRRVPGDNWRAWGAIAQQLTDALDGQLRVSHQSVRQWAITLGIPETTAKNDDALKRGEFLAELSKRGIPYV